MEKSKFVALRTKYHSYLVDASNEDKRAKDTKKFVIERKLNFENCKSLSRQN